MTIGINSAENSEANGKKEWDYSFALAMSELYPIPEPQFVFCELHGQWYWSEDGCAECALREVPEHIAASMRFDICPECGTRFWVEDGCSKCFPNDWEPEPEQEE